MPDRDTRPVLDHNADFAGALLLSIVVGVALAGIWGAAVAAGVVLGVGLLARRFAKKVANHVPPNPTSRSF